MRDKELLEFFAGLDRKVFLDNKYKPMAHQDSPLPIGFGQTISQPTLVAEMTRLLELEKTDKVLEIGTGSGYQTAFLAFFAREVYTVERIQELSESAQVALQSFGYNNIKYKVADGSFGWEEYAPFDKIIITAAAGKLPEKILSQLASPGIMVAPVGPKNFQDLLTIKKDEAGRVVKESVGAVRFVELIGEYGF